MNRLRITALSLLLLPLAAFAANDRIDASRATLQTAMRASMQATKPAFISREDLLRRDPVADVQLSPDGKFLAYFRRGDQQTDLYVRELSVATEMRVQADVPRMDMAWSGDGSTLWLADAQGLAAWDAEKKTGRRVFKWDEQRRQGLWGVDAHATAFAIISERTEREGVRWYRYLLVDAQGDTSLLHEAALSLRGVLLNADGSLRYSASYAGTDYDTAIRRHDAGGVRELFRCIGMEQCRLVDYGNHDGDARDELWLLSHRGENTLALQRWQEKTGTLATVHRDPSGISDASQLLWQANGARWLAVAYHPDRRDWYGNDANVDAQLAALQRRLPDANLKLSASADGTRWLVRAEHSTWQFERYFLYQPGNDELEPLFARESATAIAPQALSAALPVSWHARDGMLLHGYVYLPKGVALDEAPLIALPHGGPFNRDRDDFSVFAQLLVNRGYVVFLPNFRASTGYGGRYILAAAGEFGNGKVLADIFDGLDFLLALGIGDREQQAISGHSFGGYATLLAVSHAAERFRVAVASAAPPDFSWGMQWIADNGGSALPEDGPPADVFFAHYGIPFMDAAWKEKMRTDSPLANIARLQTPLYIWAGAHDDRVPLKSVVAYAGEAKRRGAAISLLVDPDSGHNPDAALNFEAVVYLLEAAMHRHFGGGLTPPSLALQRFLGHNLRIDAAGVLK